MSQLLIVDIQDKVLAPISGGKELVQNASRLIKAAKLLKVPVTVSEQAPKEHGHTAAALRRELAGDAAVLAKMHFSCLHDEALRSHFEETRDTGRGQIVIAGIEAHVSVAQTALDMIVDGYEVFVAADAVGARNAARRDLALARLRQCGAHIVDGETVIWEWLEKAGTAEFTELQPLFK
nr:MULTISPECIES: isochorismatase family protein [Rhodomicrobium]